MPIFMIADIPVNFPFEPYTVQTAYMEKVILAMENSENAVLESPTGTGKTLSLLCSSLAWVQQKQLKSQRMVQSELASIVEFNKTLSPNKQTDSSSELQLRLILGGQQINSSIPQIIFASRTHTQLKQAVQELKRSAYNNMKSVVIGSREHLCIDPETISEKGNGNKTNKCRKKVKENRCCFYAGVEAAKNHDLVMNAQVVDMEDMVKIGKKLRCCPFYITKHMAQRVDIVFTPYNYILDRNLRKSSQLPLYNSILIIDESHNIEQLLEESASIQITSSDINFAVEDVNHIIKELSGEIFVLGKIEKNFSLHDCELVRNILLKLEQAIEDIPLIFSQGKNTFCGNHMFKLLELANINLATVCSIEKMINELIQYMTGGPQKISTRPAQGLDKVLDLIEVAFSCRENDYKEVMEKNYMVHIERENNDTKRDYLKREDTMIPVIKYNSKVINFWCFNPGFAMKHLLGARTIILTSGTLAPFQPLISELGIPVQHKLVNPHIIDKSQVCVKIVSFGPDGEPLTSEYKNRDNPKYVDSLGRTILSFCNVIPHGLLVFFPSYPARTNCLRRWRETGTWDAIISKKPAFIEPQCGKRELETAMDGYYSKIDEPNKNGAIFFAVCRGKVSEGLDFTDAYGRAVIITGIPFVKFDEPKVKLKQSYLQKNRTMENGLLSPDEWYGLCATKAVNQAIGRVIRHKNDYGTILLCDKRFSSPRNQKNLSAWIQTHLKVPQSNNFGQIIGQVCRFFRKCTITLPLPVKKGEIVLAELLNCPSTSSIDNEKLINIKIEESTKSLTDGDKDKFNTSADYNSDSSIKASQDSTSSLVKIQTLTVNEMKHKIKVEDEESLEISDAQKSVTPKKQVKINASSDESNMDLHQENPPLPVNKIELLNLIKATVDSDGYKKFILAIQGYNSSTCSIEVMFKLLTEIFSDPSLKRFIVAMTRFVRNSDQAAFNIMLAEYYK